MKMNKWMAIPALSGAIVLGTVAVVANANKAPVTIPKEILSIDEVKALAEKEVDGFVKSIELDDEKSGFVYEVEIQTQDVEYELDIDAKTGKVVNVKKEAHTDNQTLEESQALIADGKLITEKEAVAIAIKQATGTLTKVELKDKDGRRYYKIEIQDDKFEYEFKINAVNGDVLEYEKESLDD